jgi:cellulose synthase/poly-beta-1,6-N-acetylglucosamine synthase-like glycosyltransferase
VLLPFLFWLFAAIPVYVYAGYPIVLWALVRLRARPIRKAPVTPSVSLLVAAYNEADVIAEKIRNSLALDYPADRLEIVIASDGSTDGTAEIAKPLADGKRVRLLAYPVNRGKLAVLNETVPQLTGDIVAFSDASSMLAPDALRTLVESFADPLVGGVSGIYKVRKADQAHLGASEDFYWKYETFLKYQESLLGSILGAHGSLYAIRRSLYPFPQPGTINDDYVIPLRVLQKGYRVGYELRSIAYEEAHEMGGFSRRVRIMTGNVRQLSEIAELLFPPRWLEIFFFLCHKVGRLVVPACMVALIIVNALLIEHVFYKLAAVAQGVFYFLAIAGSLWKLRPKMLRLPYYFAMINAAAFRGLFFAVANRRQVVWKSD